MTPKIDAVNQILRATGLASTTTLTDSGNFDVEAAEAILDQKTREFQTTGWHFNKEFEVPLALDGSGHVALPSNTLQADVERLNVPGDSEIVQRGLKFYDTKNRTFVFTSALKATIIYELPWVDLAEQAKSFLVKDASVSFQRKRLGDQQVDAELREEREAAWIAWKLVDARTSDYNIFNDPEVGAIDRHRHIL